MKRQQGLLLRLCENFENMKTFNLSDDKVGCNGDKGKTRATKVN